MRSRKSGMWANEGALGATRALRADVLSALLMPVRGVQVLRPAGELWLDSYEAILYKVGNAHYLWLEFQSDSNTLSDDADALPRALVTVARRVPLLTSRERVSCRDADDVVAAVHAEIRRLVDLRALQL